MGFNSNLKSEFKAAFQEFQLWGRRRKPFFSLALTPGACLETPGSFGINFSSCTIVCSGKLELCCWTTSIADVFSNSEDKETRSCGALLF